MSLMNYVKCVLDENNANISGKNQLFIQIYEQVLIVKLIQYSYLKSIVLSYFDNTKL